ncbi:hypothetical protein ACFFRR_002524 [Megaselia abdita]
MEFSAALEETKYGKFNYFLIIVSGVVLANVLMETAQIGFILPVSQCDLQLTIREKGILCAMGYAGIISSSHLWGFLADTKGRKKIICPTLIIGFVFSVLSSFAKQVWLLSLLRFCTGFFVSGGSATIYAYLGEFHNDKTRSRTMMGSSIIFALGAMILPLIAFTVINQDWALPISFLGITYKPWRLFLLVCSVPGFLCGLVMIFLPESPKFHLTMGRDDEAVEVLKTMYRWNTGRPKSEFRVKYLVPEEDTIRKDFTKKVSFMKTVWDQTAPLFSRQYIKVTLLICFIQFWNFVTTNGMYMWFPEIANYLVEFQQKYPDNSTLICDLFRSKQHELYGLQNQEMVCVEKLESNTYFYSFFMEVMYTLGFVVITFIIHRVGKKIILFTVLLTFGICGIACLFTTNVTVTIYLYVAFFCCGLGINVLGAATVDIYPTHLRAMAICISLMIGRTGSLIGANMVSAIFEVNCEASFILSASALLVSAFLGFLLPGKK